MLGTTPFHQNQFHTTKFTIEQFNTRVVAPQKSIFYHVWLPGSSSFKNRKFGGKDLFDWMTWGETKGYPLISGNGG